MCNSLKLFLITVLITFGTSQSKANNPDSALFDGGYVEDHVYHNDYLNFEFRIPNNWNYKFDKDQKILNKAIKKILDNSSELRTFFEPDEIEVFILLILSKTYEPGDKILPNIVLMVENISHTGFISTSADYIAASIRGIKLSSPNVKISKKPFSVNEFGKTFYGTTLTQKVGGIKMKQEYHSTIIGDFAFSAVITYQEKDDLVQIYKILESFDFSE